MKQEKGGVSKQHNCIIISLGEQAYQQVSLSHPNHIIPFHCLHGDIWYIIPSYWTATQRSSNMGQCALSHTFAHLRRTSSQNGRPEGLRISATSHQNDHISTCQLIHHIHGLYIIMLSGNTSDHKRR